MYCHFLSLSNVLFRWRFQEQNWRDNIKGKAVPLSPLERSCWVGFQSVARWRASRLADLEQRCHRWSCCAFPVDTLHYSHHWFEEKSYCKIRREAACYETSELRVASPWKLHPTDNRTVVGQGGRLCEYLKKACRNVTVWKQKMTGNIWLFVLRLK